MQTIASRRMFNLDDVVAVQHRQPPGRGADLIRFLFERRVRPSYPARPHANAVVRITSGKLQSH